jgi:hypothetical protein
MTSLNPFQTNVYSEELYQVNEADFDAVMSDGWQGYSEWSQEQEQGSIISTPRGDILMNRECSHADCHTTRCSKGATFQGIAI